MIINIHAAHQGATSILSRARQLMYWPGMDRDIRLHSETCEECQVVAPSHVKEPLVSTDVPEYPFQHVVSDLFEINGHHYLVYVDHLTAFAELAYYPSPPSSSKIISTFREFFHRWGVVEKISLNGGPNLDSHEMKQWLKKWGVEVRQSSAYYAQSNGRAEAGVKSLKRTLSGHTGAHGTINTDAVAQALLQYRNTPLRDINKSPAQLALGRQLRDTVPLPQHRYKISPHWSIFLENREKTLSETNQKSKKYYDQHSKTLPELIVGDHVRCQNARTKKWDRTGTIRAFNGHRQYEVELIGSRRITTRNRRHLKKIVDRVPGVVTSIPPQITTTIHETTTANQLPQSEPQHQAPPLIPTVSQPATTTPVVLNSEHNSAESTQHYVRRSKRMTHQPNWFHKEFNSNKKK